MAASRFRAGIISALLAVATLFVARFSAATAFVRNVFVGLIDARPYRELLGLPMLALEGPRGTPIGASLYQRNRHEAGLALLGAVRHT